MRKTVAVDAGEFWRWFTSVEGQLRERLRVAPAQVSAAEQAGRADSIDLARGEIAGEATERAAAYHPAVRVLIGASGERHWMILTPEGNPEGADAVRALAAAAPALPAWDVHAFKPRMGTAAITLGSTRLHPDEVDFSIASVSNPDEGVDTTVLVLYVRGWNGPDEEEVRVATALLLDAVLGEEASMAWMPNLVVFDRDEAVPEALEGASRAPLSSLATTLADLGLS